MDEINEEARRAKAIFERQQAFMECANLPLDCGILVLIVDGERNVKMQVFGLAPYEVLGVTDVARVRMGQFVRGEVGTSPVVEQPVPNKIM